MDEADCLGDRVMVMSAGRAKCCGSGQFLKTAFSCGYAIRLLLPLEDHGDAAKDSLVNIIEGFLGGRVSGKTGTGQELNVTVKMDQAGTFGKMFPELDNLVQRGKLKEWSVAVCSLEEVFLRVASGWTAEGEPEHAEAKGTTLPQTKRGVVKNSLQIQSMFMRRAHYMKRSWLYVGCETLAPALYIVLWFVIIQVFIDNIFGSGDLELSMKNYNPKLKLADPQFSEEIPVLAIPIGDPENLPVNKSANWEVGTLESHGLAKTISVRDDKYNLKMVELTPEEYAVDCDNDEKINIVWEEQNRSSTIWGAQGEREAEARANGTCDWNERRLTARGNVLETDGGPDPIRMLLSKYKDSERTRPLQECGLGGIETEVKEFAEKNVTNVEVIARGYSCWLQDARDKPDRPESTYGAMMLYGASGSHVLMVNTTGVHTVPIMLNVRANAILQKLLPDDEIKITFSEFAKTPNEFGDALKTFFVFLSIIILSVALAFPPPFFVLSLSKRNKAA
jgi:hypothetical protein